MELNGDNDWQDDGESGQGASKKRVRDDKNVKEEQRLADAQQKLDDKVCLDIMVVFVCPRSVSNRSLDSLSRAENKGELQV
jgi:hypothetical protein